MSDSEFAALLAAFAATPPALNKKKLIAAVSEKMQESPANISEILDALMGMESFRAYMELPTDEFVGGILGTPENLEDLEISGEKIPPLRDRLSQFLNTESVAISGKASGVLTAHQRAFTGAKTYSDIRPIFTDRKDEESALPAAAVLVHTLRIRYVENGDTKTFYVALDDADIEKLTKTLNRAAQKSLQLKAQISRTGMLYLEAEP